VVHNPGQLLDGPLRGDRGEGPVDLGEIHALRHRRHPSVLLHHWRDDRHLFGRDGAVGEGGRESGQVVQRPAVADQLPGGGGAEPTVAAQPRLHGFQAVVLSSLLELRGPDRARQLGVEPVLRLQELGDPVELLPRCQAADVVGGQCIERRLQLAHRHLPAGRTRVRRIPLPSGRLHHESTGQRLVHTGPTRLDTR
jgi:hypothetical protein